MFKKTLPFRLYAQILIFSALVALGALILWPLQQSLYGGMVSIRDNLISRLERQIGRKILYSSISPSIFGSFDVRNISIMGRDDVPLLTMSRFRIAYSLMDVLRGRTLAIRSVQIDSPLVNYNTATDKDLLDLFRTTMSGQEGPSRDIASILPDKILIRIRNGKCHVLSGSGNFAFDSLDLNAEIFEKSVALDGKWNISVTMDKLFATPVNFQITMTANGLCRMDMEDGAAIIAIPSITGDMSGENPVTFNVTMREGSVYISKKPDAFPYEASFEYAKDGKEFEGRLSCDNFRLSQLVSFTGGLEGLRQMLDVTSSGAALIGRGRGGAMGYSVSFAGSAPTNLPLPAVSYAALGAASYEIDIEGDEKMAQIKKLHFSMPVTGEASFYGGAGFKGAVGFQPLAPNGVLSLENFSISGREELNANITVNTEGPVINVLCDTIRVGHGSYDIDAFKASLEPVENGMIFSFSGARGAGRSPGARQAHGEKRSFALGGSFGPEFQSVDMKLSLDSFFAGDLAGLAAPFVKKPPVPDVLMEVFGDAAITTELTFYTDFTEVLYNTPSLVFSGRSGDRGFSGFASINGTGSQFELGKARISRGEDTLVLSARADFANPDEIGFSVNAGYQDLSCFVQGTVLNGKTVNIQGSYGLKVNLTASGNNIYSGVIHTEGFPVPFLGKPALLYLDGRLRYNSHQAWSMDFERLELTDIITPAGLAQFRASCRADQNGANFPILYYKDGFGPLSGNANLLWPQGNQEAFSEINGTAFMADNKETYQVEASFKNHSLNFWISGASMRLGRFAEKTNTLQADGEMRLFWNSIDSFNAELNLSSLRGKMYERDINVSAQAVMDGDELTVRRIVLGVNSLNGEIPQIVVNNKTGTAGSVGNLNLFLSGKRTTGALSLKANFKPVNSWAEIGEALNFFDGKLHVENFRFGDAMNGEGADPQTFDIAFKRGGGATGSDNSLMVSGGPRNMIRLQVDNNGNFYAGLSSPSPVRGTAIGNISGNTINATCNDLYIDMAGVFTYLLPQSKDIYLTGGYVNASMDIRGPISDPEFFGTAKGTSLRFMIPSYIPVELRPIPCSVVIEGNEIRFGPVLASVGKGAGSVSGRFLIDRWVPNIFDLNISVARETPVPYSFGINGFAAQGDAYGKLNVSMENMTLDVSGDLYVNNTVLGMNSDEINRTQGQHNEETHSVVDLMINTGPVVEFFYPDSKFPILRANPDMGTKLHVTADTLNKQFSLTSDIKIRGGEIFYFERSFYIRSGLLVFRENELRFAPRLTARAETRDRNEDGPVTISLIVDNAPLFDFTARFESSPPLSQMEILALMGQSLTGSQADDSANQREKALAFVNSGADMLAQFTVGRLIERQVRNFLQLDLFSLRTQLAQNLLFSVVPGFTQQPVDRQNQFGNYLDNTTLSGGKYIGQDLYVQGMLTMRYDPNKDNMLGMTFQQNYGFELEGPVVFNNYNLRIRWDFVPEHPENWWANDNAITLTFSRTF